MWCWRNIFYLFQCTGIHYKWSTYLWPDLRKGVFHTHPIYRLWQFITSDWKQSLHWKLDISEFQHRLIDTESLQFVCNLKPSWILYLITLCDFHIHWTKLLKSLLQTFPSQVLNICGCCLSSWLPGGVIEVQHFYEENVFYVTYYAVFEGKPQLVVYGWFNNLEKYLWVLLLVTLDSIEVITNA